MNHLRVAFAPYWQSIQHALFPQLERVLGPLTEKQQQLVPLLSHRLSNEGGLNLPCLVE